MLVGMDDWHSTNPSPRTIVNNFLNDGFTNSRQFSNFLEDEEVNNQQTATVNPKDEQCSNDGNDSFRFSGINSLQMPQMGHTRLSTRSGLAERASKAGFLTPTINTSHVRPTNLDVGPPDGRSPYLTIPPGLSPTTLLDSPVFLSNSMVQPSPTTGKFFFEQCNNSSLGAAIGLPHASKAQVEDISEPFVFKPAVDASSSYYPNTENKGTAVDNRPSLSSIEVCAQTERVGAAEFKAQQDFITQSAFQDPSLKKEAETDIMMFNSKTSDSHLVNEASPSEGQQDVEAEPRGEFSSVAIGAPAEDGYNWRKYGQKQVKGSEYPRSYYKCTHPSCQVKKKVERSQEGLITEIIYQGAHNHPKPPPNRRSGLAPQPYVDLLHDGTEVVGPHTGSDRKPIWPNTQDWRNDSLDATSSATLPATHEGAQFEIADAIDISSTLSNEEEEGDRVTHGSVSLGSDVEGDETESKRRKLEGCPIDMSAASRGAREPRVVVQTTSEVDILDDGYRWRKYGQKVVKGNPNPRSYYKCTHPGCNVRKHVERASHDLKSVITTYEGKHNHEVPAARNSSHSSSGEMAHSATATSASHSQNLHRRSNPSQFPDSLMRFDPTAALIGNYAMPRDYLNAIPRFGMGQHGLPNLPLPVLATNPQMKMPGLPPIPPYMPNHQPGIECGFMIPKGEPKEESISDNGAPISNGASVYHQLAFRTSDVNGRVDR